VDNFVRDNVGLSQQQRSSLHDIRQRLGVTLQGIRRFSQDLRPSIIDDLGLLPAVKWLVKQKSEESGVDVALKISGKEQRLLPEVELIIFRIVQEALNNMFKHSHATQADVQIEFTDSHVTAAIHDNGKGFELPETVGDLSHSGKLGLVGMQERVLLINGSLVIKSEKDRGTLVTVSVPIKI
jgi:signal transduction histidine kinase